MIEFGILSTVLNDKGVLSQRQPVPSKSITTVDILLRCWFGVCSSNEPVDGEGNIDIASVNDQKRLVSNGISCTHNTPKTVLGPTMQLTYTAVPLKTKVAVFGKSPV